MKRILLTTALVVALCPLSGGAQQTAKKSCEDLKAEIAAKLEAKGVKNYSLEIVAADQVKDEKVVGSCEGGSKRITYKRN